MVIILGGFGAVCEESAAAPREASVASLFSLGDEFSLFLELERGTRDTPISVSTKQATIRASLSTKGSGDEKESITEQAKRGRISEEKGDKREREKLRNGRDERRRPPLCETLSPPVPWLPFSRLHLVTTPFRPRILLLLVSNHRVTCPTAKSTLLPARHGHRERRAPLLRGREPGTLCLAFCSWCSIDRTSEESRRKAGPLWDFSSEEFSTRTSWKSKCHVFYTKFLISIPSFPPLDFRTSESRFWSSADLFLAAACRHAGKAIKF